MIYALLYLLLGILAVLAILLFALWQIQKHLNAWDRADDPRNESSYGDIPSIPSGVTLAPVRRPAASDPRGGASPVPNLLHDGVE